MRVLNEIQYKKPPKIIRRRQPTATCNPSNNYPRLTSYHFKGFHGKTAWVIGSGASLDFMPDWSIPREITTITLNGGVMFRHGKHWDYWMSFDRRVLLKDRHPEKEYTEYALSHDKAIKLFPDYMKIPDGYEKVFYYTLKKRDIGSKRLSKSFINDNLSTGQSILVPALHFCYIAGFKKIILSGCDFCGVSSGGKPERYFKGLRSMHWSSGHIPLGSKKVITPCGEKAGTTIFYEKHIVDTMPVIHLLMDSDVQVIKTLDKGMLTIPYVRNEEEFHAFIDK